MPTNIATLQRYLFVQLTEVPIEGLALNEVIVMLELSGFLTGSWGDISISIYGLFT
jgi:hypothetical protein